MAGGSWSNIFLQMIAGMPPLPVIGEAWIDGWWTQVELEKFTWGIDVSKNPKKDAEGGFGALAQAGALAGGMVAGNVAGAVGGDIGIAAAATAAAIAAAMLEKGQKPQMKLGPLKMWKRFDIASSRLHTIVDNNMPVISALITVIHIKPGGASLHQPGFTLLATDGYIEKIDITMERGDKGVEVVEEFELTYKSIIITYSKRLLENNVPMAPFIYTAPSDSESGGGGLGLP